MPFAAASSSPIASRVSRLSPVCGTRLPNWHDLHDMSERELLESQRFADFLRTKTGVTLYERLGEQDTSLPFA